MSAKQGGGKRNEEAYYVEPERRGACQEYSYGNAGQAQGAGVEIGKPFRKARGKVSAKNSRDDTVNESGQQEPAALVHRLDRRLGLFGGCILVKRLACEKNRQYHAAQRIEGEHGSKGNQKGFEADPVHFGSCHALQNPRRIFCRSVLDR